MEQQNKVVSVLASLLAGLLMIWALYVAGRYWETVQRLKINQFYGAPTAIRLLLKYGDEWVRKYDRSSLKTLGSGASLPLAVAALVASFCLSSLNCIDTQRLYDGRPLTTPAGRVAGRCFSAPTSCYFSHLVFKYRYFFGTGAAAARSTRVNASVNLVFVFPTHNTRTTVSLCVCVQWGSQSTRRRGSGITVWSGMDAALWWTPGGKQVNYSDSLLTMPDVIFRHLTQKIIICQKISIKKQHRLTLVQLPTQQVATLVYLTEIGRAHV